MPTPRGRRHPARRVRSEPGTSPCRSRDAAPRPPATAGGGMCTGRATCVCRIRRVAIEPSTSPCRACDATPRSPVTAGGGRSAGRATCVGRIRRVAIAASRALLRAARATRPPTGLPRPATGCVLGAPPVCAASGTSRSQRAEHVLVPLARRAPPIACYGQWRDVHRACHLGVQLPARRDRSEPGTSPCRSRDVTPRPPVSAGGGMCAGRATCVCSIRRVVQAVSSARPHTARAT